MVIGIVGSDKEFWNKESEAWARMRIIAVLKADKPRLVVACGDGSVSDWAIELAEHGNYSTRMVIPKGKGADHMKAAGIVFAETVRKVVCICARSYPNNYTGRRTHCMHCSTDIDFHVTTFGCWTANYAQAKLNRTVQRFIIGR